MYLSAATGQVVTLPLPVDHPVHVGSRGTGGLDLPLESPVRRRGLFTVT